MTRTNIFNNLGMPVSNFQGENKLLFVLVDFPGYPCTRTNDEIERLFFASGGANDYLKTISNNKSSISRLTTTGTEANGVIRISLDSLAPLTYTELRNLVKKTLTENENKISWNEIDRNKDGVINTPGVTDGFPVYDHEFSIILMYSCNAGQLGETGLYLYNNEFEISGKKIIQFPFLVLESEKGSSVVDKEIIFHEICHIFCMQDAYNGDARNLTGVMSNMSSSYSPPKYDWNTGNIIREGSGPTYPDIVHRIKNGWAVAEEITSFPFTGALEQHKAYTFKISETENYLIEYRPYDIYTKSIPSYSAAFNYSINNAIVLVWKINREIMCPSFQLCFNIYEDRDRNKIRTCNIISENGNEDNTSHGKCFFEVGYSDKNFKKVKISVQGGNITLNKIDSNGNVNNSLPLDAFPPINMPLPDINSDNYFDGDTYVATVKYWEDYPNTVAISCKDVKNPNAEQVAINSTSKNGKTYTFNMSSLPKGKYVCSLVSSRMEDFISPVTGYWYDKSGESTSPEQVLVSNISLNKSSHTFTTLNSTTQLTPTISPSNATNKSVTWTSSNTNVATVNSSGLVTSKANGSCTITCRSTDGSNKTATCSISVNQQTTTKYIVSNVGTLKLNRGSGGNIKLENISASAEKDTISIGETSKITISFIPPNATNKNVS